MTHQRKAQEVRYVKVVRLAALGAHLVGDEEALHRKGDECG
jgi:hypothetical protein